MSSRLAAVVSALLAGVALAGCYASTEPATDIGPEGATLNARGTANDGPARSQFEYWVTGRSGPPLVTGFHQWPAGASGPFSGKASHLAAASQYSFRVCGQDDNDSEETCGQTRTFTTKAAVEDAVYGGWWAGCCASFGVDARSGPSGENPRGSMNMRGFNQVNGHSIRFTGIVTCLKVDGATAIVGAVGDRNETPPDTTQRVSALVQIVDGRQQEDQYSSQAGFGGPTAPDCDSASFSSHTTLDTRHELIVNDAAPQP